MAFNVHWVNIIVPVSRQAISSNIISCNIDCSHQTVIQRAILLTKASMHQMQRVYRVNQLRCIPRMISCQQLFSNTHTGNIMSPPFWQTGQLRVPSASGISIPCDNIVRILPTTWVYDSQKRKKCREGIKEYTTLRLGVRSSAMITNQTGGEHPQH